LATNATRKRFKGEMRMLTNIAGSHRDQMKSILIISQLDMQKAGNQLLFRTIQGYRKAEYKVIFLTSNPASDPNRANYGELFGPLMDNIFVYRFSPLFRPLAKLLVRLKKNLFISHLIPQKTALADVADTVPFGSNGRDLVLDLLSWISFILGGTLKALWLAEHYKVRVIYGYEIFGAPVASIVTRLLRIPFVTKFQGTVAFPELERGGAWSRIPHHLLALKIPADQVVMENDGTRGKEVLLRLGVPKEKILFWVDGVKKEMYIPQFKKRLLLDKRGLNDDAKIILVASKLKKWKRVDRAIKAMPQAIREIHEAFLVVVGDGEERNNLENLARTLGVDRHVIFVGPIPHDEVKYFLNGCDLFLSLYDHSNLCNPVLEALTCGKCIVTIDDGSTKDLLTDGYNGLFIPKGNLKLELPGAIISLLLNDERRLKIAANAREYAKKHLLSWEERMALEVEKVERNLL